MREPIEEECYLEKMFRCDLVIQSRPQLETRNSMISHLSLS